MDNQGSDGSGARDQSPCAGCTRAAYARLLAAHGRAARGGSALLTTKGVRHLRRLIEAGQRPSAARSPTGDGKAETLRPRWDTAEGELRLGTELMHEFEKAAPAVTPFLDAFEAAGWTTDCLPIPLGCEPTESDKEFRARTETTVKNLNRTLRDTPLHFRLTRDRKGVHYEYLPDRDQEPGRHR